MRLVSSIVFLLVTIIAQAQVPKKVVVEHFTNTLCSACAANNPSLHTSLENYPYVMHIAYHPSSPYSGCLLNQHNTTENDNRTNFYGVYGATPRLVIQGGVTSTNVNFSDANNFAQYLGETSEISLKLQQTKYGQDSVKVELTIKAEAPHAYGTENLYVALAEDTIFYNAPNGENLHFNVFRKSLVANGILVNVPAVGDSLIYSWVVATHPDWDVNRIFAYAILQNTLKDVIQAEHLTADGSPSPMGYIDTDLTTDVSIYPNPVENKLTIRTIPNTTTRITIYDMMGNVVYLTSVTETQKISVDNFPQGVYLVKLSNGIQSTVTKLIVK